MTNSKAPASKTVARLRELLRATEEHYRISPSKSVAVIREATRLSDAEFEHYAETPYGAVPCFRETFPPRAPVEIPEDLTTLWRLDPLYIKHITAMDIETAAPLGGSSSMAFSIGLARSTTDSLVLEQLMLRGPDDEMAALWYLDETLRTTDLILTYNGSRFDYPLLIKRHQSLGLGTLDPPCRSLDLEPFARAVFGRRGFSTKLMSLEEHILATVRPSWVWHPMWQISGHLSWRRRRTVARILAKNAHDVLSLLALLDAICTAVAAPGDYALRLGLHMGRSLQGLDDERALSWLLLAVSRGHGTPEGMHAALLAWRSAHKEIRKHQLIPALEHAVHKNIPNAWQAAERLGLAFWREHRFSKALALTRRALELSPPKGVIPRLERRLLRYTTQCRKT